jgi:perosamine synthetase
MIRLAAPGLGPDEERAVREVLASGNLVQGSRVREFEELLADRVGAREAVAMSSGTAALHAALLALGIGEGDVVVLPAFSFIATANVVELCRARALFVDIDPDSFNMDPEQLDRCLAQLGSDGLHAEVVMAVHTFGRIADMPAIRRVATAHGTTLLEDAACALGASFDGRSAGTWGMAGCFSFHPRKVITTGEGGMAVTDDPRLARAMRSLRNHGQDPEGDAFDSVMPGLNYRMTELQAALGLQQMGKLDDILRRRSEIAQRYDETLRATPLTVLPPAQRGASVHQSYVILLPQELAGSRQGLIGALRRDGIEVSIGTWHMPMTTYFRERYGYRTGSFPVTDDVTRRAISLPLHQGVTPAQQAYVVERLLTRLEELTPGRLATTAARWRPSTGGDA